MALFPAFDLISPSSPLSTSVLSAGRSPNYGPVELGQRECGTEIDTLTVSGRFTDSGLLSGSTTDSLHCAEPLIGAIIVLRVVPPANLSIDAWQILLDR